jgi:hypothetical protein
MILYFHGVTIVFNCAVRRHGHLGSLDAGRQRSFLAGYMGGSAEERKPPTLNMRSFNYLLSIPVLCWALFHDRAKL